MRKAVEVWDALVRNGDVGNPRDHLGGASMIFNPSGMSLGVFQFQQRRIRKGVKGFVLHVK